jgi:hypothetical protein
MSDFGLSDQLTMCKTGVARNTHTGDEKHNILG